jgi:hypothetical protein
MLRALYALLDDLACHIRHHLIDEIALKPKPWVRIKLTYLIVEGRIWVFEESWGLRLAISPFWNYKCDNSLEGSSTLHLWFQVYKKNKDMLWFYWLYQIIVQFCLISRKEIFFLAKYYQNMLVSSCIRRYLRQCKMSTAESILQITASCS